MLKRFFVMMLVLCFIFTGISYAAEKESVGTKFKNFWRRLLNYPARVTKESVTTVGETGKSAADIVATEVKRVGEVTTGDVAKTKELVTEPITGTAEMAVETVKETVKIPFEAAKEEPAESQ